MIDSRSVITPRMLTSSEEELSALPIWTFTLGVFALLTLGLTAVPAIICGHMALAETRNTHPRSLGRSVAIVGLIIGYVGTAFFGTSILVLIRLWSAH